MIKEIVSGNSIKVLSTYRFIKLSIFDNLFIKVSINLAPNISL